jgi:hypothetical protein
MADVACFCGCLFSFDGGAGACPECGKVASVTGLAVPGSSGYSWPGTPDTGIRQLSGEPGAHQRPYRLDQQRRPGADAYLSRPVSLGMEQGRLPGADGMTVTTWSNRTLAPGMLSSREGSAAGRRRRSAGPRSAFCHHHRAGEQGSAGRAETSGPKGVPSSAAVAVSASGT